VRVKVGIGECLPGRAGEVRYRLRGSAGAILALGLYLSKDGCLREAAYIDLAAYFQI
jgi:hypothetical protein